MPEHALAIETMMKIYFLLGNNIKAIESTKQIN